jgi:hypothetical protein
MAHTVTVEPDEDVQAWFVFIDHRPMIDFNRDFKGSLILQPGRHRLALDVRGSGSTFKVQIDGGAQLIVPGNGWPLTLAVPRNKSSATTVAEFTT